MPSSSKRGLILMNLGSPDSTSVKDVRNYLNEFLMDERVIDMPYLSRLLLVKGIISPFRASKSAEAYRSVWTEKGSPLVCLTKDLKNAVALKIKEPVEISMRYGNPTMKSAYDTLAANNPELEEVILLPLYPHYAMSSYETAVIHAKNVFQSGKYKFKIKTIKPFYNNPDYINALCNSIKPYFNDDKYLLFSYHSIPERHIHKSDITGNHCLKTNDCCMVNSPAHKYCYKHQCLETTRLVCEKLGILKEKYGISFQSKLGRAEWLKPSTTATMEELPAKDIKDIMVICPAFISDCLETLEEVAIRERENFMNAGGKSFTFIPCLNIEKTWVETIKKWMEEPNEELLEIL